MHSLWKLKYSQKFEMEAWRAPCTGQCRELCTNSTDVGHTATVPTDVITTSAFLKEGMKKERHGCEPQGCAPELCQDSVCSRAALTPLQAWMWESHGALHEVGTLHCLLSPAPSTLLCASPVARPQTPPLISNSRDSTAYPGTIFQSFAVPAVKANHPFGCLSSVSPAVTESLFLVLPAAVGKSIYFLLCTYPWLSENISSITLKPAQSPILSPLSLLFPSHLQLIPIFQEVQCPQLDTTFWERLSATTWRRGTTPCILQITFLFIHPIATLGFFFRKRMLLNHVQLVIGYNPRRTLLHSCYRGSWLWLLLKSTNMHLSNPLLDLLHHMLTLFNLTSSLSVVFVFCSVSG